MYIRILMMKPSARRRVIEDIIYSQDPIDLLERYFGGYEGSKAKGIKEEHVEQNHVAIALLSERCYRLEYPERILPGYGNHGDALW